MKRPLIHFLLAFFVTASLASAAPVRPAKVPQVSGTTWSGTDSLGGTTSYTFEEDGTLSYTSRNNTYRNGTWKQNGAKITLEKNDKYAEYEGEISGDTIEGKAKNVKGLEWTWKMTKDK